MKTCKTFFHKSLIIEDAAEFAKLRTMRASMSYGFCLLSIENHDYTAQRIYRFTENFDVAHSWLLTNNLQGSSDVYGVVLGCDL